MDSNEQPEIPAGPVEPDFQEDREAQPVSTEEPPRLPFAVVGIGASAGGLEAVSEFLAGVRADSPMAYVFIQHLPPTGESMLVEILEKRTTLKVMHVDDGLAVQPNHLYVIRPGQTLTISDGAFHLGKRLATPMHNRPVDDFFKSLAQEQRQRGIGVILSGMGSNGAAGAQAIKAVGGLCVAQDPETANFPSMPQSLIDAGYADYVLRPQDMGDVLLAYAGHPYAADAAAPQTTLAKRDMQQVREILAVLRTRTRQDFTGYKKPTVLRRIQRRMGLSRIDKLDEYAKLLRQNPTEVAALADDLLIHVTGFFRDPEAWDALREKVINPLISSREPDGSIRCWVTACSSGEEAYSLAILLVEEAERAGKPLDIKVFATDMADRTLQNARSGVYPGGIESEIDPQRLERFFQREDAIYRVRPELRERVVFAPQNILQDPPFSRLDIASCRNLLIYLEPEMQKRILSLLHFGLRDGGSLFLGSSELAGSENLFETIDKKARIYRRIGPTRHGTVDFITPHALGGKDRPNGVDPRIATPRPTIAQMSSRALLEQHTPPAVAIDRDRRIVYYHGNTEAFIGSPRGEPTRDLLDLVRDNVRGAVRTAVHRAGGGEGTVTVNDGWVEAEPGRRIRVAVTVSPLDLKNAPDYLIVSFHESGDVIEHSSATAQNGDANSGDLRRAREELQSTIEELQTSNEELKASHEEVVSVNEELQSSNEELEASREEMQSLNEELATVNSQLQAKIEEHLAARNDLASLLTSTNIAVLFLDTKFRIRRYTPQVLELFELRDVDVGRPLSDLAKKFADDDLIADSQKVLITLVPIDREVKAEQGHVYLRRTTPYRTADNRIDGVVVSFIDITARMNAEAALRKSEESFRLLVDGAVDFAMIMIDPDGKISAWNDGAKRLIGFSEAEALGMPADIFFTPEDRADGAAKLELAEATATGSAQDERWHCRKNGEHFWGSGTMNALRTADGTLRGFVKVLRDNTRAKQSEEALQTAKVTAEAANHTKDEFLAVLSHELRTPLSAILLWSKLLHDQLGDETSSELKEGLNAIQNSADAQKDLIEDLLDVSRIATGNLRLQMVQLDLVTAVRDAAEAIQPTADLKNVALNVQLNDTPISVRADSTRLRQIIWNLLTNAVKFTPAGGSVGISISAKAGEAVLTVSDTGIGIEPDFLPHVFDRFRQADASSTRRHGGLGLGLSIVRQLAELHGGTVSVESDGINRGSTFTLRLPIVKRRATNKAGVPAGGDETTASAIAGRTVLFVEDDEQIRGAISTILKGRGLRVIAAVDAKAAFELLEQSTPDLIISDIGLPGEDGHAFMQRVRNREHEKQLKPVPSIALTAYASDADRRHAYDAGFHRFLAKPVNVSELIQVAAALVAGV